MNEKLAPGPHGRENVKTRKTKPKLRTAIIMLWFLMCSHLNVTQPPRNPIQKEYLWRQQFSCWWTCPPNCTGRWVFLLIRRDLEMLLCFENDRAFACDYRVTNNTRISFNDFKIFKFSTAFRKFWVHHVQPWTHHLSFTKILNFFNFSPPQREKLPSSAWPIAIECSAV